MDLPSPDRLVQKANKSMSRCKILQYSQEGRVDPRFGGCCQQPCSSFELSMCRLS